MAAGDLRRSQPPRERSRSGRSRGKRSASSDVRKPSILKLKIRSKPSAEAVDQGRSASLLCASAGLGLQVCNLHHDFDAFPSTTAHRPLSRQFASPSHNTSIILFLDSSKSKPCYCKYSFTAAANACV